MKQNKISIIINSPIESVFDFTINPENTPKWIDGIENEEVDKKPINLGTIYRNVDKSGVWTEYEVVQFYENKIFELKQKNSIYHVRYDYDLMSEKITRLTYFEWVDDGDLTSPFSRSVLEKLKNLLENNDE